MLDVQIAALATANPPLRISQKASYQAYVNLLPLSDRAKSLLQRIFVENRSIGYRHFGMDNPAVILQESQDDLIARYRKYGVQVALEAANKALDQAGLTAEQIDGLLSEQVLDEVQHVPRRHSHPLGWKLRCISLRYSRSTFV